jgi:hypothetical protein
MYYGSIPHDRIIEAFRRAVPGCYVRDYRDRNGFITVCRDTKDMPWRDQTTTRKVYREVPATTLCNLPRGNVTSATHYRGLALDRPGWRQELRRAGRHLSDLQKREITEYLGVGEIFQGII